MNTITSPQKPGLPQLSEDTILQLKNLRDQGGTALFLYVKSLRNHGWPLRAISTPLGVSRTAVSNWEKAAPDPARLPATERFPEPTPKQVKPLLKKFELTVDEREELKALAHEASKVRRFTDPDSESRQAAKRLESLFKKYSNKGASLGQLAQACDVSRSSVAQRLRKYRR